jgi:hypothetical protein
MSIHSSAASTAPLLPPIPEGMLLDDPSIPILSPISKALFGHFASFSSQSSPAAAAAYSPPPHILTLSEEGKKICLQALANKRKEGEGEVLQLMAEKQKMEEEQQAFEALHASFQKETSQLAGLNQEKQQLEKQISEKCQAIAQIAVRIQTLKSAIPTLIKEQDVTEKFHAVGQGIQDLKQLCSQGTASLANATTIIDRFLQNQPLFERLQAMKEKVVQMTKEDQDLEAKKLAEEKSLTGMQEMQKGKVSLFKQVELQVAQKKEELAQLKQLHGTNLQQIEARLNLANQHLAQQIKDEQNFAQLMDTSNRSSRVTSPFFNFSHLAESPLTEGAGSGSSTSKKKRSHAAAITETEEKGSPAKKAAQGLLDRDINTSPQLPTSYKGAGQSTSLHKMLLLKNKDVNLEEFKSTLRTLRQTQGPDKFKEMIDKKINGVSLVHLLMARGSPKLILTFLTHQPDLAVVTDGGWNCLHLMSQKPNFSMYATEEECLQIVSAIVSAQVDVDALNGNGVSACHLAAYNDNPFILKALLAHAANVHLQDTKGKTAKDYAEQEDNQECRQLLLRAENSAAAAL